MKLRCDFCGKRIDTRGICMHVSARHRGMVLAKFRMSTEMLIYALANREFLPSMQLALPAPNPLTVYSRRPLGYMAAPIPQHRRPKGYQPPQNYARPVDLLMGALLRYGRSLY